MADLKWLTSAASAALFSAVGIGVLVSFVLLWMRTLRMRKRFPRTFRSHWRELLGQELHDVCYTVPVVGTVVSNVWPQYGRVMRIFDPDSTDLAVAWDLMGRAGVPRAEVEDLEDVRRLLRKWLVATERGDAEVQRYFLIVKVGAHVAGLVYFQNFPRWRIAYTSYYATNDAEQYVGLASESLRTALLANMEATEDLRAILFETSEFAKYRTFRMMLTSDAYRRTSRIVGLPKYRQPPISPEESGNVVPLFLVCCWIGDADPGVSVTRDETISLLQFMKYNYSEAFEGLHESDSYLKSLDVWYAEMISDLPENVPLWTSERDIPLDVLSRLTKQ